MSSRDAIFKQFGLTDQLYLVLYQFIGYYPDMNSAKLRKDLLPESPLRRLRREADLKRGRFANELGCSYETVKRIEYGLLKIGPDIAIRAMLAFGVRPESLIESSIAPLDLENRRYSQRAYHLWKAKVPWNEETSALPISRAIDQVRALLTVSCRLGRFPAVLALLGRFLYSASHDLGLSRAYQDELLKTGGFTKGKDLASEAKAAGKRLGETFRESRKAYTKYMRDEFPQEIAKISGKSMPAPPEYHTAVRHAKSKRKGKGSHLKT